jgi:transposase
MATKHRIHLIDDERRALRSRITSGRAAARELTHARVLLKADEAPGAPAWSDAAIARALDIGEATVWRIRKRFVEQGLQAALGRQAPRRQYPRKLDGLAEAHLVALSCSAPPLGRRRWTLQLLADKLVQLRFVDGVSYETVRRVLKKTS